VNLSEVAKCRNGELGTQLQLEAERKTTPHVAETFYVPTILFDGKCDMKKLWQSVHGDFRGVVNKLIKLKN
jgi:hypothetical protein